MEISPFVIGLIGFGILLIFLAFRMTIGYGMMALGFVGFAVLAGTDDALGLLKVVPFSTMFSYDMAVLPLFMVMGHLCFHAGISQDIYATVHVWIGQLRGGLAMATIGACAGFAAVSGSGMATAATMGTVALPEMRKYKYSDALATGCIAAGGTIGSLIPPSIVMIIFCILTAQSVGKLFMAGFIPGILEAIFYMITIYIICKRNPLLGPPGPRTTFKQRIYSLRSTWSVLILVVVVMGGIYTGAFTPTEAGGIGAFGALVIGLSRRKLGWQGFKDALIETGKTAGMIFVILTGAMILNYFIVITRLPSELANLLTTLEVNRYVVFALILFVYLILGCIMDTLAMMLLTVPIFFPIVVGLGFDPIWFGIMIIRIMEVAMITPPVGLNVFIIKGVAKDVPLSTIFRGIVPFFIADILHISMLMAFPQIALFLPGMMK